MPSSSLRIVSPAKWHITDFLRPGQKSWSQNGLCQRFGNHLSNVQMADKAFLHVGSLNVGQLSQQGICYVYMVTWIKLQSMDL